MIHLEQPSRIVSFDLDKFLDVRCNYENTFELDETSFLTISFNIGSQKTSFSLKTFELNSNLDEVGSEPPKSIIEKQNRIIEILDYSCIYCTNASIRFDYNIEEKPLNTTNDYREKYENYMRKIKKQPLYTVSCECRMPISYGAKCSLPNLVKAIDYTKKCIKEPILVDILALYASGALVKEYAFVQWFKCCEKLEEYNIIKFGKKRRRLLVSIKDNIDLYFLGKFPQLTRHNPSNSFRNSIKKKYKHEYNDRNRAISKYRKNLRPLIDYLFKYGKRTSKLSKVFKIKKGTDNIFTNKKK